MDSTKRQRNTYIYTQQLEELLPSRWCVLTGVLQELNLPTDRKSCEIKRTQLTISKKSKCGNYMIKCKVWWRTVDQCILSSLRLSFDIHERGTSHCLISSTNRQSNSCNNYFMNAFLGVSLLENLMGRLHYLIYNNSLIVWVTIPSTGCPMAAPSPCINSTIPKALGISFSPTKSMTTMEFMATYPPPRKPYRPTCIAFHQYVVVKLKITIWHPHATQQNARILYRFTKFIFPMIPIEIRPMRSPIPATDTNSALS